MTTLAELATAILPNAGPVGAQSGPPRAISWVRVMRARVPAFDALEAGDLAIVPESALSVVAPGESELRDLATAFAAARVSGVVLIESDSDGGTSSELLDLLLARLETTELPALRMARTDPSALERTVIGFLVTQGAELDRQAALLEARLQQLALDGGGPEALVAAIATFLGRAVALEGRRGNVLAVHAPTQLPDAATAVARYHAHPRQAAALRVALPAAGGVAGSLALLGERPVGELERISLARIAGFLALELSRDEAVRRARDEARRAEAMPPAGPPWVVLMARQRTAGAGEDLPEARDRREATRRDLRAIAPGRRMALRGDADSIDIRAVLAVDPVEGADPEGLVVAAAVASFLERVVAVSRPFGVAADRPAAEAEARATLEAAEQLAERPRVARAALIAVYRLLVVLHNLPDRERLAGSILEPLLTGRPDVRRERLETVRALLDHGSINESAAALGVHRNTVAYRVRRIEEVTGWRLADPDLRLSLAIAFRLVHDA